jgi:hypothetical protein
MRNGSSANTSRCVKIMSAQASIYQEALLTVIDREYRTAEGWLSGRSVPTGESFMNLMVESETLADEVMRRVAQQRAQKEQMNAGKFRN